MQVHQREGESLRDYMQRFNKATLDIDNVLDTICLSALLHGLKSGRFLDDLLENPPKTWNEVNDSHEQPPRREEKKKQKVNEQWGKLADFPKYANYIPLTLPRSQILAQIQHWVRRPPPPLHDSLRADKSKHCDYHHAYGHNTKDYQHLKDELEFLTRNGKGRGTSSAAHRMSIRIANIPLSKAERTGNVSSIGEDKDKGLPPRTKKIGRGPLKRSFEEAEWENTPITFSPTDYKRAEGEPDVMMPHADPFMATVHIGNHNVNKVFIDIGSSPDILYWSCFQKMQLNPSLLQKYEGPIYGFDNQPVPVEGVITIPIYVGSKPCFRMASVSFLVVKMESAFNAILGRATLCELKVAIFQPHLYMKFPTPQGLGVLKGNQKMARACYQDTFKKVELVVAPTSSENHRPTQLDQQTMSISDIEHRPKGVEQKVEPVEPVETVPLNPDVPKRIVKIGTKLTEEERAELLEFLRVNQDVFAWTTDEMPSIPMELTVHKLSFIRRVEYSEWVSNLVLVKKPNGKWRMCINFTNLNEACPKDPHPLPNVEKLVERAVGHERISFLDASPSGPEGDVSEFAPSPDEAKSPEVHVRCRIRKIPRAFDELKQYLVSAPLLSKPVEGESLYLYLGVTEEAVSSVLLREENKNQKPICYVSKVLQGVEQNYPLAEKAAFALVCTARKLRAYFQSHQIVVYTDLPLRKILQKLELSGRLIGWSVELSEYDLKFQPRTTIKGQVVANFLVECISTTVEEKAPKHPVWVLYVDGTANVEESGAEAVPHLLIEASVRAKGTEHLDISPHRSTIVEVLDAPSYTDFTVECQLLSTDPSSPSWTTPLIDYLHSGELLEDPSVAKLIKRKAAHFTLLDNQLYKQAASMPLLRCLTPYEANYAVREVHEGVCGTHISGRTLARKLLRHGYYWPTMVEDSQNYVKKCPTCQFNANDIHMPSI
ncbi:hypothetical protein SLEP1_g3769 [Rubroshorea leprosula]|uniref:Reverse transcriptase/retrotransposon-derived protein RNase H-like domain-containing protein n=1 Tax=Rubroshorea leprosula TaxID=152421 RepID=A0AAV5HU51_9ROSI|nr:hypothetical protein SLEP1_g3769 [Rubroshorea leprosula]